MARILLAELKQETATFNPAPTHYEEFRVYRGPEVLTAYRGTRTELAGALEVFAIEAELEVVPAMAASAVSGGPLLSSDWARLCREMATAFQAAGSVDAVLLVLHGAMVATGEDDPEGFLLETVRQQFPHVPVVATLDLHAVLTERMLKSADLLVPFHTYPHVDQFLTGQRAARLLLRLLRNEIRPTTVSLPLPMLVRGDELITATGLFGEAIRMCQEVEAAPWGLAAGVIIGNAFTDVPALQSYVLVSADGDLGRARQAAEPIARFMWQHRERFQAQLTSLPEAIRRAEQVAGLTVFSDGADATASGAAGDSNAILRGLLEQNYTGTALIPIVDAPAAESAHVAGVGQTINVRLGGTRDPGRFQPLTVAARVCSLHDGDFRYEDGTAGVGGRTAVLAVGSFRILVTSCPVYVVGQRVFQAHGLDPRDFQLVVVKSPNGYRTWYEGLAAQMIPVDVPGSTSANLRSLPYSRCVRPIFPLDHQVTVPSYLQE